MTFLTQDVLRISHSEFLFDNNWWVKVSHAISKLMKKTVCMDFFGLNNVTGNFKCSFGNYTNQCNSSFESIFNIVYYEYDIVSVDRVQHDSHSHVKFYVLRFIEILFNPCQSTILHFCGQGEQHDNHSHVHFIGRLVNPVCCKVGFRTSHLWVFGDAPGRVPLSH